MVLVAQLWRSSEEAMYCALVSTRVVVEKHHDDVGRLPLPTLHADSEGQNDWITTNPPSCRRFIDNASVSGMAMRC